MSANVEIIHAKLLAIGQECARIINTHPGCDFIVLIGKLPNKGWPRGKCLGSDSRGRFYSYKASHLLAKIVALGIMTVEMRVRADGSKDSSYRR